MANRKREQVCTDPSITSSLQFGLVRRDQRMIREALPEDMAIHIGRGLGGHLQRKEVPRHASRFRITEMLAAHLLHCPWHFFPACGTS